MKSIPHKIYAALLFIFTIGLYLPLKAQNPVPGQQQQRPPVSTVPGGQKKMGGNSPGIVNITFIQMNDVYEIAPVQDGKYGGLARVATIIKRNKQSDPNTFTFLSGDFLSPSAVGLASDDQGIPIKGKQMVDVLNRLGVDFVTFGNHEFDVKEAELQQRINESTFEWISSNVSHVVNGASTPFTKTEGGKNSALPSTKILTIKNRADKEVKVGIIALTLPANQQPWVHYDDYLQSAKKAYDEVKDDADFVIAVTHLSIDEDKMLAKTIPQLKLIMGGHEHENILIKYGNTYISKADANAVTVYVHRMHYNLQTHELIIQPMIKTIDSTIVADSSVERSVNAWMDMAFRSFEKQGIEPGKVVTNTATVFDGFEKDIRFMQTNLGELICNSMLAASKNKPDAAILNSGSIRLDDELTGEITQYDILRVLPFGGQVLEVEMKGTLLKKILDASAGNTGSGGYLQYSGISMDPTTHVWMLKGGTLDEGKNYLIVMDAFLMTGQESKLDFLTSQNPDIIRVTNPDQNNKEDLRNDIRLALIDYMEKHVK